MKLSEIQAKLKAPKNQTNAFGKYKYRSCEDILEAVKPLLGDMTLTISDEIVEVSGRIYVKATASLYEDNSFVATTTAFAREPEEKKGMDASQITGAASSYARKYALNGLFLIDDTKDADSTNQHGSGATSTVQIPATLNERLNPISVSQKKMLEAEISNRGIDREKFKAVFGLKSLSNMPAGTFQEALEKARKKPLLKENQNGSK